MPDVTVKGREAYVMNGVKDHGWFIYGDGFYLRRDGEWHNGTGRDGYWPTREAAEQFLREHADHSAASPDCRCRRCLDDDWEPGVDEHPIPPSRRYMVVCQTCGNKRCPHAEWHGYQCTGSNEPEQVPQPAVTINNPLADLIFRKCGLNEQQAVRVAEVLLWEGVTLPASLELAIYSLMNHVEIGKLAVSSGLFTEEQLRPLEECFRLALQPVANELTALREQVTRLEQERDAAREDVAHLALLRNDMLKDITARDEELRRVSEAMQVAREAIRTNLVAAAYKNEPALLDGFKALDDALASPPPPRTYVGDGKPLPPGVWVARQGNRLYPHRGGEGKLTCEGWTYTFVGPVPEEEGK